MNHTPIYLSRDDHSKLRRLLACTPLFPGGVALRRLREELDRAAIIDPAALPAGVVAMESTVTFEDLETGETEEYTITFPEHADVERNRISILAPIGTALIGCRAGDVVKWSTPGGIRKLKIRRVAAPADAEAAARSARRTGRCRTVADSTGPGPPTPSPRRHAPCVSVAFRERSPLPPFPPPGRWPKPHPSCIPHPNTP